MSNARNLAALLDTSGDVVAGALDNAGGGGVVELIASTTVSSATNSVAFTSLDLTGYSEVKLVVGGMAHAAVGSYLDPVVEINGEDGYDSSAQYYVYGGNIKYRGFNFGGGSITDGGHASATITLIPGNSTRHTMGFIGGVSNRSSTSSHMGGTWSSNHAWSMYAKKEVITTLTFQWWDKTHDITQGEFYLYGIKTS